MRRILLSWSSGKDCAWTLHMLRQEPDVHVVGLLTTFNQTANRVAMHAVRRELVEQQAAATGLPLWSVNLPWPCSNAIYEEFMSQALQRAKEEQVDQIAFGDLFLEDVRDYRIRQLEGTGIEPLFPLWGTPQGTRGLAIKMLASGVRAILTCVDPKQLSKSYVGREFNSELLAELPPQIDPCGERGEFHTFCFAGPMFHSPISIRLTETVERDGFWFADLQCRRAR